MTVSVLVAGAVTAGLVTVVGGLSPAGRDRGPAVAAEQSGSPTGPAGPTASSGPPASPGSSGPHTSPEPAASSGPSRVPGSSGTATSGASASAGSTSAPLRTDLELAVPSLGLRSTVAEVAPVDGVIDPPRLDRAYVIAPYGRPGSDNTTYIAGHSWNRGDAVFNPLLDVPTQEATIEVGETVVVTQDGQPFTYRVTSSRRYPKGTLAEQEEVWRRVPDRLVLITCFQRNDGAASRDNLVVVAELVDGPEPVAAG